MNKKRENNKKTINNQKKMKNNNKKKNENKKSRNNKISTDYDVFKTDGISEFEKGINNRNNKENKKQKKIIKPQEEYEEKDKKKINKIKIFFGIIIIAIIIAYVCYLMYNLFINPTNTVIISKGTLSEEESQIGYIIREETVVQGQNYKNGMEKIKSEGERVAKGDSIFRYYSTNESELNNEIEKIDQKIQEAMNSDTSSILPSDIKLLENKIDELLDKMDGINDTQTLKEYKENISTYMTKKAKIAGEYSPSGSYLKQLINQRTEYENELETGAEYIKADESGMVSYRVDGFEDILSPNNLNNINKELLEGLKIKTGQTVASNEECGKIVNNYYSYIAFNSNSEEAKNVQVYDNLKIRILNSDEISATVQNILEEDDGSRTITLKIKKGVEELIQYRKISFDIIWWSAEGYKIPNSAIIKKDNLSYVIRNRNGYLTTILVKILKQNDKYSIVDSFTNDELVAMGYSNTKISEMKKIALYDEILNNPNEKQLLQ